MQESIEASIVRIHGVEGHIVGAGFLVGERHILTCAHVISKALDLPGSYIDPPPGIVSLDFPRLSPHTLLDAKIVLWCPPLPDGSGDLAGLELEQVPPIGVERVRFASAEYVWKHDFSALGFPDGYDDGIWATGRLLRRQASNWIQIEDIKAQGFAVGSGFSGAPVWDEQLQGVVGMVVAASRPADTKTAFVIPSDVLAAAWSFIMVPQGQPRNPYKGLRPFTQRDAADFFGREAVVEKVVDLINSLVTEQPARSSTRLLTILGPSGVGKSSLVMAGVLPKLQQGAMPGSKDWVYLDPIVPGKSPLEALTPILKPHFPDTSFKTLREDLEDEAARGLHLLATQLAKQRGTRVVLLIDQCEELFTQTESENERQRFIRLLLNACSEPRGALLVLLTLRADFYDRPMQYPELFRVIDTQHLSLLAIEPEDLRRVVEQPAALPDVQVTFESDLVNRLLFEVQGQPGALPLLQFTLDQLFQKRSERKLTLSADRELGGVKGALTRQAEEAYDGLPSDEHRKLAHALFVRLIDPGALEQDATRRRATLSEFTLPEASQTHLLQGIIDEFIRARLLTTNEIAGTKTIEVSHEALIREWPRLAGWLREAREDIPLQQTISRDAAEWERRNRPDDRLYRGSQLKESQAWARRNTPSGNEVAFLRAGAERRIRIVASLMVVVLLLLSTIGIATWFSYLFHSDPTHVTTRQDDVVGSLRWCIENAPSGSTISFAQGMSGTIVLTAGDLTFAGGKTLIIAGPGANQLTISGGDIGSTIRVSRNASVIISGLSFKNSKTSIDAFLYNQGTLTVTNSVISDNKTTATATSYGGGIENTGTLTVINSTISNNSSSARDQNGQGGGIFNEGTLTVTHSTFSYNSASSSGSGNYGGIGGGIYNAGTLMVANSSFSANSANSSGSRSSYGGGIANDGKLTVTNSTFSYDTANSGNSSLGGGIVNSWIGTLMVTTSTFSDNSASGKQNAQGGGIANDGGKLTVVNSSFVNNTASVGGGISSSGTKGSSAIIHFCTFYRNTSSVGGGIWVDPKGSSHLTISSSIISANSALRGPDISGVLTSDGYNLIEKVAGAIGLIASTDRLVTLAGLKIDSSLGNNGGSTQTLALLKGSPAIDAVPLETCRITITDPFGQNLTITTDQRGMKRPDGNESACDIGAYEYQDTPT